MRKNFPLLLGLLLLLLLIVCHTMTNTTTPTKVPATQGQRAQEHFIQGPPSLSANFIDHLLCTAGSPACHTGQALYHYGKQYGIDPAYALAFFQHESSFGKYGIAHVNKGLGNIRCTDGYTCISGFRAYSTWQAGYLDWYQLIRNFYIADLHKTTVEAIVPTYAPPQDHNDTAAYIAAVVSSVQNWRKVVAV